MDPARRDHHGGRVFQLQDCQPDVLSLREKLLEKARVILLKLSPMLDWHAAVHQLDCVREVHIVATGNECKELLLVCSSEQIGDGNVCCVNNGQRFCFPMETTPNTGLKTSQEIHMEDFLYEPNTAVMKGGCFGMLCEKYKVVALGHDSHLFTSPIMMDDFPGRRFRIKAVSSFNKKELNRNLSNIKQANIAVRHFPLSANELRKRLKLRDGGDTYLFATTFQPSSTSRQERILMITEKA